MTRVWFLRQKSRLDAACRSRSLRRNRQFSWPPETGSGRFRRSTRSLCIRPCLGSGLAYVGLDGPLGRPDRNDPRAHLLGQVTHELDVQQPVGQARSGDLDVIGELEAALET